MPNLAATRKAEISRLARKEVKSETAALRKTVASLRTELSSTKKKLRELEGQMKRVARSRPTKRVLSAASTAPSPTAESAASATGFRFSAKGLTSNRKRLGLSTADYGRLVGATGQAVASWEKGTSRPRARYLQAIAELRGIGKREASRRLSDLPHQAT
jgi:DNA-binding transcriptional regulator YiaG